MGIREWCSRFWHRIRGEKSVEEGQDSSREVVEMTAEPAPEPVPDRKTSDEIIQEMADSHLPAGERMQEESPEETTVKEILLQDADRDITEGGGSEGGGTQCSDMEYVGTERTSGENTDEQRK